MADETATEGKLAPDPELAAKADHKLVATHEDSSAEPEMLGRQQNPEPKPAGNEGPEPKVDDQYWFNFSEQIVTNALEKPNSAADKLQNLVIWLWGIYTSLAGVGFALAGKKLAVAPAILIAISSGALIIVYWLTVWVQMPVTSKFDPRSPTDIREAYSKAVSSKLYRLHVTLFAACMAAILVAVALVTASVSKDTTPVDNQFVAKILRSDNTRSVAITGRFSEAKSIVVQTKSIGDSHSTSQTKSYSYLPTADGLLQITVPLESSEGAVEVQLAWQDAGGNQLQISKQVQESTGN